MAPLPQEPMVLPAFPPMSSFVASVGWTATAMSYQHCPSQKPAAAGMSVQLTPSGEELMVPVLLEAQVVGTSSKTAKNVVVGVPPVERLTANLVTGVAGPPLIVNV